MKRGIFDLLRRGFDNAIANWQVSLLRFVEIVLFFLVAIGAVLAIAAPILVTIGVNTGNLNSPEEFEELFQTLMTKWALLIWIVIGFLVLMLVWTVIHSFVEAGCASILVDGDRLAGPQLHGTRARYRAFTFERWLSAAKDGWLTVFWIYFQVWGVAMLILLVPLLPTLIGVLLLRGNEAGVAIVGCLGLLIAAFLMIVVGIVAGVWCNRAIVDWAVRRGPASDCVTEAWAEIKSDVARHLVTAIAIFVVSLAGSMFLSSFSMFAGLGEVLGKNQPMILAMTVPIRIFVSLLNYALSSFIASWFVATYAAIATDPYR